MPAGSEPKDKKPLKQDPTEQIIKSFKRVQMPDTNTGHQSDHRTGHKA